MLKNFYVGSLFNVCVACGMKNHEYKQSSETNFIIYTKCKNCRYVILE